jgi:antitoxin ParD1/3/4
MSCPKPCDEDAQKIDALHARIKAGVDALDRGDFIEIDDAELADYFEQLTPSAGSAFGQ